MTHFNVPSKKKDFVPSTKILKKLTLPVVEIALGKVTLTKRARRAAKKLFRKSKHSPWGYSRFPPYQKPELPLEIVAHQARVNEHAIKMFKRPYFKLTSQQQTKVFEDLNTREHPEKRETIH